MKRWLWLVLLLPGSSLFARNRKLQGYVMDPAVFRKIKTYCVDTHNLPPDQVKVIEHFVSKESQARGLLTKLPWVRRASCQEAGLGAVMRLEFPHDATSDAENEVKGALLVFRPGAPSPIYETPAVSIEGEPRHHNNDEEDFKLNLVAGVLEYSALSSAVRILIHDWRIQ